MKFLFFILFLPSSNVWCQDPVYQKNADSIARIIEQKTMLGNYKTITIYNNISPDFFTEDYTVDSLQERLYKVRLFRISFDTVSVPSNTPAYVATVDTDCMIFYYDNNNLIKVTNSVSGWAYYIKNEEYVFKEETGKYDRQIFGHLYLQQIKFYNNKFLKNFPDLQPPEQPGHLE